MMRPVLAVLMGAGDVQDRGMDMKLRIVLPARAMRKRGGYQVRWNRLDFVSLGDPRV